MAKIPTLLVEGVDGHDLRVAGEVDNNFRSNSLRIPLELLYLNKYIILTGRISLLVAF